MKANLNMQQIDQLLKSQFSFLETEYECQKLLDKQSLLYRKGGMIIKIIDDAYEKSIEFLVEFKDFHVQLNLIQLLNAIYHTDFLTIYQYCRSDSFADYLEKIAEFLKAHFTALCSLSREEVESAFQKFAVPFIDYHNIDTARARFRNGDYAGSYQIYTELKDGLLPSDIQKIKYCKEKLGI